MATSILYLNKEFGTGAHHRKVLYLGCLYTCRMPAYLQEACILVGCLYTCRMSVYL